MGGRSPAPKPANAALLSHVPGSVLQFQPDAAANQAGSEQGVWLGPDGSFLKRVLIVGALMSLMGALIVLMHPKNQPAMCREFVRQVSLANAVGTPRICMTNL